MTLKITRHSTATQ